MFPVPRPSISPSSVDPTILAALLSVNAELDARNSLLLSELRKLDAEDQAYRTKHLGCDLKIEALQEDNEALKKELQDLKNKLRDLEKEDETPQVVSGNGVLRQCYIISLGPD